MTLATVDQGPALQPRGPCCSSHADRQGFVFFTNHGSRKGHRTGSQPGRPRSCWPGCRSIDRSASGGPGSSRSARAGDGGSTSAPGPGARGSAPGPAISRVRSTSRATLERRLGRAERALGPITVAPTTFRCRRIGAATWSGRSKVEFWQGPPRPGLHDRLVFLPAEVKPVDAFAGPGRRPRAGGSSAASLEPLRESRPELSWEQNRCQALLGLVRDVRPSPSTAASRSPSPWRLKPGSPAAFGFLGRPPQVIEARPSRSSSSARNCPRKPLRVAGRPGVAPAPGTRPPGRSPAPSPPRNRPARGE